MTITDVAQRQRFYTNLLSALRPSFDATFAACKPSQGFSLASFRVTDASFKLPLPAKATSRLRDACKKVRFGNVKPAYVESCWQVDGSKVSFPGKQTFVSETIQTLAMESVIALGLDGPGLQLEARLSKLLLYEAGSHLPCHTDLNEEEEGVFAILLLQLPTEEGYEGGKLVIKHSNQLKELDCHMVGALGFCCTVFFADCLVKQEMINSGTKLCLAFKLIKRNFSLDCARKDFICSQVRKVEASLEPWLQTITDGTLDYIGRTIAIPLRHRYREDGFCLKGNDIIVAEVLKNCKSKTKEPLLDLHICVASQMRYSSASRCTYGNEYCQDPDHHSMLYTDDEELAFGNLLEVDGKPASAAFKDLDMQKVQRVCGKEGPFDSEPDRKELEDLWDREFPTLEYWYDKTFLVLWPKSLSLTIACEVNVSGALDLLEKTLEISDPNFNRELHQVISYSGENTSRVWDRDENPENDSVTPRLLRICAARSDMLEATLNVIQLLSKYLVFFRRPSRSWENLSICKIGVRNAEVAKAIAAAVQVYGWESFSLPVIDLAKSCALSQGESFLQLTEQLLCVGEKDAGVLVAQAAIGVFGARIAEIESLEMAKCSWCQPLARFQPLGHPDVQTFLEGPNRRYVQKGFQSLSEATSFAETYFNSHLADESNGYSASATPGGQGDTWFCDIQKTGVDKANVEKWLEKQRELKPLRLTLGKFKSAVSENSRLSLTKSPRQSDQPAQKRQRLETN